MAWAVRRCKRCGAPLVAEEIKPERWERVYKSYEEAVQRDPRAGRVIVETLPQVELDERAPLLDGLRFFKPPFTCPKYPGKSCES